MASKKRNGTKKRALVKSKKKTPAIRRWPITSDPTATVVVIDVGKHLSKLNHRLYRQGRNYRVKIDITPTSTFTGQVDVFALNQSWMNHRAWQMASDMYKMATSEERKMLGNQKARWEDFRVNHGISAGGTTEVNPGQYSPAIGFVEFTAGEFVLSEVETEGTSANHTFTWGSPGASEFGILQEYELKSNTDTTPTTVETDMPYAELIDTMDAGDYVNLQENGDLPPYNANGGFQNCWNKVGTLYAQDNAPSSRNVQRLSTAYFDALCGFVAIRVNGNFDVDAEIICEVKEGDYKGVSGDAI